jgi:LuxR family transcriptional regulator, maltose regulon positive regulatory protein
MMHTKFYWPRRGRDVIQRTRLIERLDAGLNCNATLISAPPGFGKTTLLVEWLATKDCFTAWLSLDEHDNELPVFVYSLASALQTVFPGAFQATGSLIKAPHFPSPDQVAIMFINEMDDMPGDAILVLDDYHRLRNHDIHTLVEQLIEHLPPQLHLVLATRSDPPLPLARWRARGYLNDLRPTDLRFALEETETFLKRMLGNELAYEIVAELEEQTEGWIAVLRLAALSLRNTFDQAAFMERLRNYPDRSISNYLMEEIFSQQVPIVQEFLVQTSILEQFCAELCVAILGSDTSYDQVQAILGWLDRSNVLVIPLDERHGWYRFYHLFRQLLQQRLHEYLSTEELAALHRRASVWYEEQGLIEQAIGHALAAGDASGAAQMVEAHFLRAFEQERRVPLERWLHLLPEEQLQSSPLLLFAQVWIFQAQGQLKDLPRLLTAAEQFLGISGNGAYDADDPEHRFLHALLAVGWCIFQFYTGQAQASLESALAALQWLGSGEGYAASQALFYLALSYQAIGQEDIALATLQQALRNLSANRNNIAFLLRAQARVFLAAGKLHQVEHTARHLLRLAQEADLPLSRNLARWLLGVVYYEWNKLDAAVYHYNVVIAHQHQAHFWTVQDSLCGLALAYQSSRSGTEAWDTSRGLLSLVQEQHNMGQLMVAYAFCGQLALLQDEVEEAAQWLDMAREQGVLGPMMFLEDPPVTTAWMLLAKGDQESLASGQVLLDELLKHVETIHSTRKMIQVLVLQAWAYDLQGYSTRALDVLERALKLALPSGFIRTFANISPLARLLHELLKRRKERREVDNKLDAYIRDLLAAMSYKVVSTMLKEALPQQESLEPLTEREVQILRLLDKNLTNKEIAHELVVTPGTVKVHISNVYRKLSVNNRRAAISFAKTLGLLAADNTTRPLAI